MLTHKTVRVLALDGGGTRGYLSAKFLEKFCQQWGVDASKLYERFDAICGTSTGGILALGLAIGLTPTELTEFYREKAPWIFTIRTAEDVLIGSHDASEPSNRPNLAQKIAMIATNDPFYKAAYSDSNYGEIRLKTELTDIFGDKQLDDLAVPVILPAYNFTAEKPMMFGNIDHPDYTHLGISCVEAAMATSSAPMYLPKTTITHPVTEEAAEIIDGGIVQNNPLGLGFESIHRLFPYSKRQCLLSVGTGLNQVGYSDATRLLRVTAVGDEIKELIGLIDRGITSAQMATHKMYQIRSTREDVNMFYYRFNALLDNEQDTELDNSTEEFFDYLDSVVTAQYEADAEKIGTFIGRLDDDF